MATTAKEIITTAKRFLGCNMDNGTHKVIVDEYNKINPLPRGYKLRYTDPYCAGFVSAMAHMCNALDIIPAECSCGHMLSACSKKGIFIEKDNIIPELADIIFFDWQDSGQGDCAGYPDHVGFVMEIDVQNKLFKTIEGNKNRAVGIRTLPFNSRYIRGWARPTYTEEVYDSFINEPVHPLDTIARFCIRGDYGNNPERASRLTALGYDAAAVQDRINELLGYKKK